MSTNHRFGGTGRERNTKGRVNFGAMLVAHWLGLSVVAGAPALARQDAGPASGDPLGGPSVVDRAPPGERAFGEQPRGKGEAKFARRGAPHGMFLRALGGLRGDLAVTEEQREQIMAIEQEFRAQMQAFRAEHQDEIAALREQAGKGGRRFGRGPGAEQDASPEAAEARAKLKALMEGAPKADEFQARQWAILSAEQQNAVKSAMEDMRETMQREGWGGRGRGPGGPEARGGPEFRGGARRGGGPEGPDAMLGGPGREFGPGPRARGPEGRVGEGRPPRDFGRGFRGPKGPGGPEGAPPPPPPMEGAEPMVDEDEV